MEGQPFYIVFHDLILLFCRGGVLFCMGGVSVLAELLVGWVGRTGSGDELCGFDKFFFGRGGLRNRYSSHTETCSV